MWGYMENKLCMLLEIFLALYVSFKHFEQCVILYFIFSFKSFDQCICSFSLCNVYVPLNMSINVCVPFDIFSDVFVPFKYFDQCTYLCVFLTF